MLRASPVIALEKKKREPVVRAREIGCKLERTAVAANGVIQSRRLRVRDRHVLEDARIVGPVAQGESIRGQRRIVVALTLQRERLAQIVEALRLEVAFRFAAEQATPPGHAMRERGAA